MRVIVGLGNPGEKYAGNRHNVGFMVVDRLASQPQFSIFSFQFSNKFDAEILVAGEVALVKPQTFMNQSGEVVAQIVNFYKTEASDLWVVHDDLDIRLGLYKIQLRVGPKIHYGLNSIEEALGTKEFWRARVGVDNRESGENRVKGDDYVLADFEEEEVRMLSEVMNKVSEELLK